MQGKSEQDTLQDASEIAKSGLETTTSPEFMKLLESNPEKAITSAATVVMDKARKGGMNDLGTLAVAGSLIITGIINILAKLGIPDRELSELSKKAMKAMMQEAVKQDRFQNGYTEDNTPPDENGQTPRINPTDVPADQPVVPSAIGGV